MQGSLEKLKPAIQFRLPKADMRLEIESIFEASSCQLGFGV